MSGRNLNRSDTASPVNHRRHSTPAAIMDAIGRMDDETGQPIDPEKSKITPPASPSRPVVVSGAAVEIATRVEVGRPAVIEALEIDEAKDQEQDDDEEEDEDDNVDSDLERLLASTDTEAPRAKRQASSSQSRCVSCRCGKQGPGNTWIVFPRLFAHTGWGMSGPHWFGPFFVLLIILWASHYFIKLSLKIGPITTTICVLFMIVTIYNLVAVSFHDPGIVTDQTPPEHVDMSRWRWCEICKYVGRGEDCIVVSSYSLSCSLSLFCVPLQCLSTTRWTALSRL